MQTQTRYVIEVINYKTNLTKHVILDYGVNVVGSPTKGTPALRQASIFPMTLSEEEKDFVVDSLKNARYVEMTDGGRHLPDIIARFGAVTTGRKEADFLVMLHKVDAIPESVLSTRIELVSQFRVIAKEGHGKSQRDMTNYTIQENIVGIV